MQQRTGAVVGSSATVRIAHCQCLSLSGTHSYQAAIISSRRWLIVVRLRRLVSGRGVVNRRTTRAPGSGLQSCLFWIAAVMRAQSCSLTEKGELVVNNHSVNPPAVLHRSWHGTSCHPKRNGARFNKSRRTGMCCRRHRHPLARRLGGMAGRTLGRAPRAYLTDWPLPPVSAFCVTLLSLCARKDKQHMINWHDVISSSGPRAAGWRKAGGIMPGWQLHALWPS